MCEGPIARSWALERGRKCQSVMTRAPGIERGAKVLSLQAPDAPHPVRR